MYTREGGKGVAQTPARPAARAGCPPRPLGVAIGEPGTGRRGAGRGRGSPPPGRARKLLAIMVFDNGNGSIFRLASGRIQDGSCPRAQRAFLIGAKISFREC